MNLLPTLGSIACRSVICYFSGISLGKALVFNGIDMIVSPTAEKMIHNRTIPEPGMEKKVRIWVVIVGRATGVIAAMTITHASLGPMNPMIGIALDVTGFFAGYFLIKHAVPGGTKFCTIF
jgi:hypothetical protein